MTASSSQLERVLRCPECGGDLNSTDAGWDCSCGAQGLRKFGILDFVPPVGHFPLANQGSMDLRADEQRAAALAEMSGSSFAELVSGLDTHGAALPGRRMAGRAVRRFAARYARVEEQAGDRHGRALLAKVDAHLTAAGRLPAGGQWALEAGGGHGKFLLGFREAFEHAAFVDCSLVNIMLARTLAREQGLDHVLFVRADVTRLPFRDGQFDLIHENGVIEHVHEPTAMVVEALRVRAPDGIYVCLSPNRFPVTPEPHFSLPLFGLFPAPIRRHIIRFTRGKQDEAGTQLRTLHELREIFEAASGRLPQVFFLPPRLPLIARSTLVRRLLQKVLDSSAGKLVLRVVNGPLLGIAPYHLVVVGGVGSAKPRATAQPPS